MLLKNKNCSPKRDDSGDDNDNDKNNTNNTGREDGKQSSAIGLDVGDASYYFPRCFVFLCC